MKRIVACSVVATLVLSWLFLPGLLTYDTVRAQQEAPQLNRLRPSTITAGGPTFTIRLEGKKFAAGAKVLLDGVALPSSRVFSKGRVLLAEIDASVIRTPGMHTVQAINPDGMTSSTETLTVVAQDSGLRVQLEGNAAQEDPGVGFIIGIRGEGFNENSEVLVWGRPSAKTTFISDTRLTFELSENLTRDPARIPIVVRNKNDRFSNVEILFIVPRPPKLGSVDPESIEIGTEDFDIEVFGNNFKPDAVIIINGVRIEPTERKDGQLKAKVPGSLRSTSGQLVVRVEQEGIQSDNVIIAVAPKDEPFIFALAPGRIRQGEERKENIEVVGANFKRDAQAFIDGQEARVRDSSTRRRLVVAIPEGLLTSTGTHTVQVKLKDGPASNTVSFEVVPDVTVSTLAGDDREGFNKDESCVSSDEALFRRPRRLTFGPDGLLYVTDQQNHAIRTINVETGQVCTVAGTGESGYNDSGNPRAFSPNFSFPNGVAVDSARNIYVTDNGNNVVRRIRRSGSTITVDTFAGSTTEIPDKGRQDKLNSTLVGLQGFRDGPAREAAFRLPDDILITPDGTIYLADANNHAIRRIRQNGDQVLVETVAGNGVPGFADGIAENARFNTPTAIALSLDGNILFVADTNNDRIRQIDLRTGLIGTFAGSGDSGGDDGPPIEATFDKPIGLAIDVDGVLYVSEFGGNRIRRVSPSGDVSTLAGDERSKFREGPGLRATFNQPRGIAIDRVRGILYIADYENFRIRKIALR